MVQRGIAHVHNAQLWSAWASPLQVRMTEGLEELTSTLQQLRDEQVTHVWLADSAYEPLPTAFRRMLFGQVWEESKFTIFKAARPTFARLFYDQKMTAEHDVHDKYGGLRYVEVEAALSDIAMEYDKTIAGKDIDYLDAMASKLSFPFSMFHLSSNEPLTVIHPSLDTVKRLYPSIKPFNSGGTILESHKTLAHMSDSQMFFVMDADLLLESTLGVESFTFGDEEYVHLWYVMNPINGLIYGHGGPKAFNKDSFTELEAETVDVTTSSNRQKLKIHTNCVGIHRFNYSEEASWRTAFRECAKLTWQLQGPNKAEAEERLSVWTNLELQNQDEAFWEECLDGAQLGSIWASQVTEAKSRRLINDFGWLHERYQQYVAECALDDEDPMDDEFDPADDFEEGDDDSDELDNDRIV